ncbi:DUF4275 family protein [Domibacillus sp. A3M-37]|uniref:DUF4275 family protein n=1 Tax=Domibacillus sp. A3M-37 TaxID=2962037 RepID=UPI0020B6712F|nr:DUF4275 family protein [Domibacillus sp. A3M-37]MCP3764805.1 DUF4275 family protein [Domibacillus sp. A3M-37]
MIQQINLLKSKGILVTKLISKKEDLRKQWEEAFAKHLSKSQKGKIYFHQHLWHVFSYNKLSCLEEQKARDAFNKVKKKGCYIFYRDNQSVLLLENAKILKAEDILKDVDDCLEDVYVVDKDFTWTYVFTHEEYCGPYFYQSKKE